MSKSPASGKQEGQTLYCLPITQDVCQDIVNLEVTLHDDMKNIAAENANIVHSEGKFQRDQQGKLNQEL